MSDPATGTTVVAGEDVRLAMRSVPSAVTVVTVGGDEPDGITIGSFVSVSLDPPLISFNVQRSARIHDVLESGERYAVHVLSAGQEAVSETFANPDLTGAEQLDLVAHEKDEYGVPDIEGAIARIECSPIASYRAGDHSIFVGRVTRVRSGEGEALIYLNRGYTRAALS